MNYKNLEAQPAEPAALFVPTSDYALRPWPSAFANIDNSLRFLLRPENDTSSFDVTAFYSRRVPNLSKFNERRLEAANNAAYDAALALGGLVVYFQGELIEPARGPDKELEISFTPDCLSFCIWKSRRQALDASELAAHGRAVAEVNSWYQNFRIHKFNVDYDILTDSVAIRPFDSYNGGQDGTFNPTI